MCIIVGESGVLTMFFGQKDIIIDDKSRLILPSLFRSEFTGNECYVSFGLDKCIELYPSDEYQKKATFIKSLSDFDIKSRNVKRTFLSNTFKIQIDSHNRILLPKALTTKTNINKKVMVVGMFDHLELWDLDTFIEKASKAEESFSNDAQELIG